MHNLWSIWNNTIVFNSISDFVFVKNLYTNHKSVLYLYDLDWHVDSIDYNFTIDCLKSVDLLCCRNEAHADKIEELCGRRPIIVSNNLKELVDDLRNTK